MKLIVQEKLTLLKDGFALFFEKNLTSYSYLFFAQVLIIAVKVVLKYPYPTLINSGTLNILLLFIYGYPAFFVVAAIVTHKFRFEPGLKNALKISDNKKDKIANFAYQFFIIALHVFDIGVIALVIFTAFLL